jgi:hypothetical protein
MCIHCFGHFRERKFSVVTKAADFYPELHTCRWQRHWLLGTPGTSDSPGKAPSSSLIGFLLRSFPACLTSHFWSPLPHLQPTQLLIYQLATKNDTILLGIMGTSAIRDSDVTWPCNQGPGDILHISKYSACTVSPETERSSQVAFSQDDLLLCTCSLAVRCKLARSQGRALEELPHCSCHSSPGDRNSELQTLPLVVLEPVASPLKGIFLQSLLFYSWSRWLPVQPSQAPSINLQKHKDSHDLISAWSSHCSPSSCPSMPASCAHTHACTHIHTSTHTPPHSFLLPPPLLLLNIKILNLLWKWNLLSSQIIIPPLPLPQDD